MQLNFLGEHDTYPQEFRAYVNTKLVPAWRILKARGWMELSKWQSKDIENSSYASCTSTTGFYRFPISQIDVSKGLSILKGQRRAFWNKGTPQAQAVGWTTGSKRRRRLPKGTGVCTIPRQGTGQCEHTHVGLPKPSKMHNNTFGHLPPEGTDSWITIILVV